MVSSEYQPSYVFIAGYQDLTDQEFAAHYEPEIDEAINNGSSFLLSDQLGACTKAFEYIQAKNVSENRISLYKSSDATSTNLVTNLNVSQTHTVPGGERERYAAMAKKGDTHIIWLRPGDTLHDHGCISASDVLDMQFNGAVEAMRAVWAKEMQEAMDFYDTIV